MHLKGTNLTLKMCIKNMPALLWIILDRERKKARMPSFEKNLPAGYKTNLGGFENRDGFKWKKGVGSTIHYINLNADNISKRPKSIGTKKLGTLLISDKSREIFAHANNFIRDQCPYIEG